MKRLLNILLNIVIYIVIVVAIVWGLPKFLTWKLGTNYPIASITSGSMWPVLKTDDIVLIEAVAKENIKIGDIVVWSNGKTFTIHRVVKLDVDTLTTKGDANFSEDAPVKYENVVGQTVSWWNGSPFRIPYLGLISVWAGEYRGTR